LVGSMRKSPPYVFTGSATIKMLRFEMAQRESKFRVQNCKLSGVVCLNLCYYYKVATDLQRPF